MCTFGLSGEGGPGEGGSEGKKKKNRRQRRKSVETQRERQEGKNKGKTKGGGRRREKALLRSRSGPLAGAALAAVPTSYHNTSGAPFVSSVASTPSPSSSSSVCACLPMLHARRQHCCQDVGSQWSWQLRRSVARRARGSLRMSWSVIWTCQFHSKPCTAEDLKSWLMGLPCLEECNWPSAPRW